jgi:hypothetical protein
VIVLITLGAHYAATEGVLMALGSGILPETVRSSGLAVLSTGTAVARFAASALFGLVWSHFGLTVAVAAFMAGLSSAVVATMVAVPKGAPHA